jgi:hypothetical protein
MLYKLYWFCCINSSRRTILLSFICVGLPSLPDSTILLFVGHCRLQLVNGAVCRIWSGGMLPARRILGDVSLDSIGCRLRTRSAILSATVSLRCCILMRLHAPWYRNLCKTKASWPSSGSRVVVVPLLSRLSLLFAEITCRCSATNTMQKPTWVCPVVYT